MLFCLLLPILRARISLQTESKKIWTTGKIACYTRFSGFEDFLIEFKNCDRSVPETHFNKQPFALFKFPPSAPTYDGSATSKSCSDGKRKWSLQLPEYTENLAVRSSDVSQVTRVHSRVPMVSSVTTCEPAAGLRDTTAQQSGSLVTGVHTLGFTTALNKRSCIRCPRDQWTNDNNQCTPKETDYLSYSNDSITLTISIIVIFLFLKTSVILGIFTLFRDTPVVRATNQSLSFFLLVSIMLSFLCIFLFLGHPTHVTCMLRQTLFGIIFSVAISSILAKTIMVYMAFKATKPGSKCRKFIGVKITNCLVFVCSIIQVVLCIFWLSTAPPFPENNFDLYADKIILQCNEGSIMAFSIILGYIGFLAAISFVVAFLARNLPDSFNEAKNITFSMLVVCSVWVAFIPAYLSVTGISTVLVEIFAILSSNVGILVCIFYPKCYIIILKPDLNSKDNLLKKHKYGRENKTT
ncbi:vomeronasal type-2 receptor 26-like [Anomaloglossus baeobatrachus]|uniref:vomeronasal type-2 receptor 26-like n=1 Tax=Anomaloglossus baeobatrachus TaxID=238106 RepID=UPI003F4F9E03